MTGLMYGFDTASTPEPDLGFNERKAHTRLSCRCYLPYSAPFSCWAVRISLAARGPPRQRPRSCDRRTYSPGRSKAGPHWSGQAMRCDMSFMGAVTLIAFGTLAVIA